jgi:acyl-CoA synthetase (AMP-forming)/AMP-acid ligase II
MIHSSPHPAVAIAEGPLHHQVLVAMDDLGPAPALVDDATGRTLSGHEVAGAVRGTAAGLQQRGHGPGDVVCIAAPASPEWLIVALATLATGATVTTANPLVPAAMLTAQLESCAARTLVTVPALLDWAQAATAGLGTELVVVGEHRTPQDLTASGAEPAAVPVDPAATAFLLHSSGTSGLPKRVMLPHRACVAMGQLVRGATGRFQPDDCTLMALPLFHAGGLTVSLASMLHGVKLVLQPRFELPRFLHAIAEHRVTFTVIVPPIVQALARHPWWTTMTCRRCAWCCPPRHP